MAKLSYTFVLTRYCIIFVFMRGDKYYFSKITLQKHTFENFGRLWKSNDFLLPKPFDSNTKVTFWIWILFYPLLFLDCFWLKKYCKRCQSNVELSFKVLTALNLSKFSQLLPRISIDLLFASNFSDIYERFRETFI